MDKEYDVMTAPGELIIEPKDGQPADACVFIIHGLVSNTPSNSSAAASQGAPSCHQASTIEIANTTKKQQARIRWRSNRHTNADPVKHSASSTSIASKEAIIRFRYILASVTNKRSA